MDTPKPIKVLIAEDEDSFRMVLQRVILSNKQYEFSACASGDEVIELLKQKQFDVLILDHMMPGRSGLNILQWMLEQKMDTPVIMLTGAGSENIAVEAMKLGAYDYIRKETFEKEHLPHIINSAHERYLFRKERELRRSISEVRGESTETLQLLSRCVRSIQDLLKTSLDTTSNELDSRIEKLSSRLPAEHAEALGHTLSRIRQQYEVLALCSQLFIDLTDAMSSRAAASTETDRQNDQLRKILRRIEEFSQRRG